MIAHSLSSPYNKSYKQAVLNQIVVLLSSKGDLCESLSTICNYLTESFHYQSIRIRYQNEFCQNIYFMETPWRDEITLETSGNNSISIEFFFTNEETYQLYKQNSKRDPNYFTLILNLISGSVSRKLLERLIFENKERNKELTGINKTTEILEKANPLEESLTEMCLFLPDAWQYPDYTVVRIIYENKVFTSPKFTETTWVQREYFYTPNNQKGVIEIYYLKEFPTADEGPFLSEERNLLNNISNLIAGSATKAIFKKLRLENTERLKELNAINQTPSQTNIF